MYFREWLLGLMNLVSRFGAAYHVRELALRKTNRWGETVLPRGTEQTLKEAQLKNEFTPELLTDAERHLLNMAQQRDLLKSMDPELSDSKVSVTDMHRYPVTFEKSKDPHSKQQGTQGTFDYGIYQSDLEKGLIHKSALLDRVLPKEGPALAGTQSRVLAPEVNLVLTGAEAQHYQQLKASSGSGKALTAFLKGCTQKVSGNLEMTLNLDKKGEINEIEKRINSTGGYTLSTGGKSQFISTASQVSAKDRQLAAEGCLESVHLESPDHSTEGKKLAQEVNTSRGPWPLSYL
jgi:hypothetical protein